MITQRASIRRADGTLVTQRPEAEDAVYDITGELTKAVPDPKPGWWTIELDETQFYFAVCDAEEEGFRAVRYRTTKYTIAIPF